MTRTVKLPIRIDVARISYQQVISIDLHKVPLPEWCINLCLLKEELTDALVFIANKKLKLTQDKTIERSRRAIVNIASDRIHIAVHPEELSCWLNFFLVWYCDGLAPVNHFDVEALSSSKLSEEEVYITFAVGDENAQPPMSAEEARRILANTD